MKYFNLLVLLLFITSCSVFRPTTDANRIVTISSSPTGAEIFAVTGEKIGDTPRQLTEADLKILIITDHLNFIIHKSGFLERQVVSSVLDLTDIKLTLNPITNENFNEVCSHSYNKELNLLTREILLIHGLIFLTKYQEALDKIILFQKKFPGVAASYTLMGSIYKELGKHKEAKEQFLRALSIDKNDETASRALSNMDSL